MGTLRRLPYVAMIFVADIVFVRGSALFIAGVWRLIRPIDYLDVDRGLRLECPGVWIGIALGILAGVWLWREIFKPRFKGLGRRRDSPAAYRGNRFPVASTHPSYVLIDMLVVIPSAGVLLISSRYGQNSAMTAALIVSMSIPAVRLLAWYGLNRRVVNTIELATIWKPVALFAAPFVVTMLIIGVALAPVLRTPMRRIYQPPDKACSLVLSTTSLRTIFAPLLARR